METTWISFFNVLLKESFGRKYPFLCKVWKAGLWLGIVTRRDESQSILGKKKPWKVFKSSSHHADRELWRFWRTACRDSVLCCFEEVIFFSSLSPSNPLPLRGIKQLISNYQCHVWRDILLILILLVILIIGRVINGESWQKTIVLTNSPQS